MKKSSRKSKLDKTWSPLANIKVIGVGGGGGNAVSRMSKDFVRGIDFVAINTDQQDLDECGVKQKVYIGRSLTRGMGTGMNPELGRQAAEENRSEISEIIGDADIVFLSAGMGGGTGTGATPVVAEVARQCGALTIAVVTKPFAFEGSQRERIAQEGLLRLKDKVDALIVVPNDRIFSIISKDTPILKAFKAIDDVLRSALKGIVELIITPGIINVDFADVKAIIQDAGSAIVGVGIASGQDRAVAAVTQALNSPLLEVNAEGAHGVLLGISGSRDLKMSEINDAARLVAQTVDPAAKIIFGAYYDRSLQPNQVKATIIATGFSNNGTPPANSLFSGSYYGNKQTFYDSSKSTASEESKRSGSDMPRANHPPISDVDDAVLKSATPARATGISSKPLSKEPPVHKKKDSDLWDIPAFLRRRKK